LAPPKVIELRSGLEARTSDFPTSSWKFSPANYSKNSFLGASLSSTSINETIALFPSLDSW